MDPVSLSSTKSQLSEINDDHVILEEVTVNCPLCGMVKRYKIHVCEKNKNYPPKDEYVIVEADKIF